ncbi:MAG: rhomboid family intramembrane serine protease [Planctomycetota bacterium]|nr:rhomboid family intramembrane serine protease [Planctomycetota bacterium]
MLIPLGTDRPLKRPTLITHALLGINVVVYLVQQILQQFNPDQYIPLLMRFWLDPTAPAPWTFLTYQFLHGDFLHLLGNSLVLFVFGPNVEDRYGRIGFLAFYLVGGFASGGAHILFEQSPVIGASGAIAGVTGAYLVLFPLTHIRTLLFFFIIGIFNIPAVWYIGFAIARDLLFQGLGFDSGVAYLAHLGGYLYGAGVAIILLASGKLPREPYDLFSLGRQAHRRRRFKEITSKGLDPWSGAGPKRGGAFSNAKPNPREEALSSARAEVARRLAEGDQDAAVAAHRALLTDYPDASLGRKAQLDIANIYFQTSAHEDAARAYRAFLERHPRDAEAPRIRLMLGLLYVRYLDRADDARPLLEDAREQMTGAQERELAEGLLAEARQETT